MARRADAPRSVAEAVNIFVSSRRPRSIVSTADGIFAVRQSVPGCEHTNRELAELVASTAIRQGCNVAFDAERDQAPIALATPKRRPGAALH